MDGLPERKYVDVTWRDYDGHTAGQLVAITGAKTTRMELLSRTLLA